MSKRGFTLVELIVAMVLLGIVSTAIYQLLVNNQRVYLEQRERVDLNSNLRAAVALLPSELRELDAADAIESDILAMGADSIVYKAMRALYVLCQPPTPGTATTGTVVLATDPWFGLRELDAATDAVVLFAEADPSTRTDNYWVHAQIGGAPTKGGGCPGGDSSLTVQLWDVNPANSLNADVQTGAPLRTYQVMKLRSYTDARGDWWLGQQTRDASGSWGSLEPVLGPLAPNGLQFAYYDEIGAVTTVPANVARVQITVIGITSAPVSRGGGAGRGYILDTLVAQVALRNNP
ncbi:MAG: PilW family protein [Gemmatimonadales bacterium]